jgi:protein-disulfide isomerase
MRTLLILISAGVIISVLLSAWALVERNNMKVQLAVQNKVLENIEEDIKELKSGPAQAARPAAPSRQQPSEVKVSIDDDPIKGDLDAPVTIVEFSDYQCPFCKRNYDNVLSKIEEEYISKGKVRLVFRDYPLAFHKKAVPAAMAANCAGEQGKYWEVHDFLFENPDKLDIPVILESAQELGLNKAKFEACVNDKSKESEITDDFKDGQKYGVTGTPSFFIGRTENGKEFTGTFIRGAQPFDVFKQHIDELLDKAN